MIVRKFLIASALAAAALAGPAHAQPAPTVGATVSDSQGGEVGQVTAVTDEAITLRTDRHEAAFARSSFTVYEEEGQTRILFGLTRDQVNAEIDRTRALAARAFSIGSIVHDRDGAVVGPVQALDAETVTVQVGEAGLIRLPRNILAPTETGLSTGATLADLRAAAVPAPAPEDGAGQ